DKCPHCGGSGHVRSVYSVALQLLRAIDEMLLKGATHNLIVRTRTEIALYLLNHKRAHLRALEERFHIAIMVNADATIGGQLSFVIEKGEQVHSVEQAKALAMQPAAVVEPEEDEEELPEDVEESEAESQDETPESEESFEPEGETLAAPSEERGEGEAAQARGRRRRRRGRRGERREDGTPAPREAAAEQSAFASGEEDEEAVTPSEAEADEAMAGSPANGAETQSEGERRRRRRGRRGGRRNRRDREGETTVTSENGHAGEEAEVSTAAPAEFNGGPVSEAPPAPPPPAPTPSYEPVAEQHAETPAPAAAEPAAPAPEPPRRRSTVREPAPIFTGQAPAAPPPMPMPT